MKNMENKYFTPDIEDLCIGYELVSNLEKLGLGMGRAPLRISKDNISHVLSNIDNYEVPHLTKEQIEAEGWKERTLNSNEQALLLFSKNGYDLRIYKDYVYRFSKLIVGAGMMPNWDKVLFEGECKDINTFRTICKLLKIN